MKVTRAVSVCAAVLALALGATAQDNGSSDDQNNNTPVLKTRPHGQSTSSPQQQTQGTSANAGQPYGAPANAIPDGTRFIIRLKNTLDTKTLEQGQHFTAELREDLLTPSGLRIPRGRTITGYVATFEHGYTGARMQLALDEIETRKGWVPLIGTITGVPGDPSIKSTGEEGEIYRKGPDMKRVVTNAAIGAGVGAASGAAAGGGKGAAVGALAGAGLGSGSSLLFHGRELKLEQGTNLEVRLNRDLVVPTR